MKVNDTFKLESVSLFWLKLPFQNFTHLYIIINYEMLFLSTENDMQFANRVNLTK